MYFRLLIFLLISEAMAGDGLDDLVLPNPVRMSPFGFLAPNELHPIDSKPLLDQAPQTQGAYLAVGTERGFIGASLTPNIDTLVLVDIDPSVVEYNRVNTLLLKIAKDREDFLRLRLSANTSQDWLDSANKAGVKAEDLQFLSRNFESFRAAFTDKNFALFHNPENFQTAGGAFHQSNYLFSDELFAKVKRLADHDRIWVRGISIADPENMNALSRHLAQKGVRVNVMDLSNVLQYSTAKKFWAAAKGFATHHHPGTLVLLTGPSARPEKKFLSYGAFTLEHLATIPDEVLFGNPDGSHLPISYNQKYFGGKINGMDPAQWCLQGVFRRR